MLSLIISNGDSNGHTVNKTPESNLPSACNKSSPFSSIDRKTASDRQDTASPQLSHSMKNGAESSSTLATFPSSMNSDVEPSPKKPQQQSMVDESKRHTGYLGDSLRDHVLTHLPSHQTIVHHEKVTPRSKPGLLSRNSSAISLEVITMTPIESKNSQMSHENSLTKRPLRSPIWGTPPSTLESAEMKVPDENEETDASPVFSFERSAPPVSLKLSDSSVTPLKSNTKMKRDVSKNGVLNREPPDVTPNSSPRVLKAVSKSTNRYSIDKEQQWPNPNQQKQVLYSAIGSLENTCTLSYNPRMPFVKNAQETFYDPSESFPSVAEGGEPQNKKKDRDVGRKPEVDVTVRNINKGNLQDGVVTGCTVLSNHDCKKDESQLHQPEHVRPYQRTASNTCLSDILSVSLRSDDASKVELEEGQDPSRDVNLPQVNVNISQQTSTHKAKDTQDHEDKKINTTPGKSPTTVVSSQTSVPPNQQEPPPHPKVLKHKSRKKLKRRNSSSKVTIKGQPEIIPPSQLVEMFRPSCDAYTPRIPQKKKITYLPAEQRTPRPSANTTMGTISRPNFRDALRRVAMIIHQHIVKIECRFDEGPSAGTLFLPEMRDLFKEENFIQPKYKISMVRIPTIRGGTVYGMKQVRKDPNGPCSPQEIYEFAHQLFKSVQLSSECSIVCLIYVEKLMEVAKVPLMANTWKPIMMCGLLLASKVWQDLSSWNIEFASVYPQYPLDSINRLEVLFLKMIKWDLYISSSLYAKYYFALRSLLEKQDFRQRYNRMVGGVGSVDVKQALKVQKRTELIKEEALLQLSQSM